MGKLWLLLFYVMSTVFVTQSTSSATQLLAHVESNASDWRMSTFSQSADSGSWFDDIFNLQPEPLFLGDETFSITPQVTSPLSVPNIHDAAVEMGVDGIVAPDGIRYFRSYFTLPEFEYHSPQVHVTIAGDQDFVIMFNGAYYFPAVQGVGTAALNWEPPFPSLLLFECEDCEENAEVSQHFSGYLLHWSNSVWRSGLNRLDIIVRNPTTGQGEEAGGFAMTFDFYGDAVPEPGSLLALVAVAGVGILRRRPRIG